MRLFAAVLAERVPAADMHRHAATHIRKREIGLAIAAIGGAQQREQCLILIDRQQLAIA
ncbi:hypothetical protein PIB19_14380 [Sphingomonas sp. 7/4-4]|nr:hypothetical protein [Sphingomonas sp. 7/4-4]WBY06718.1 hypothetical protein PIB19_14380 [Sphingomonas sp. 7/4-4]